MGGLRAIAAAATSPPFAPAAANAATFATFSAASAVAAPFATFSVASAVAAPCAVLGRVYERRVVRGKWVRHGGFVHRVRGWRAGAGEQVDNRELE